MNKDYRLTSSDARRFLKCDILEGDYTVNVGNLKDYYTDRQQYKKDYDLLDKEIKKKISDEKCTIREGEVFVINGKWYIHQMTNARVYRLYQGFATKKKALEHLQNTLRIWTPRDLEDYTRNTVF